jgi:MFS family permease
VSAIVRARTVSERTFRSLKVPNGRRFFVGMCVSATGQWLQVVAQGWLVLELTDSGVALGILTACQFLPILLGGAWGGVIADRFDKRRILFLTQTAAATLAFILGMAVLTDVVTIQLVFALALCLGCVNAIDNPTRRSFVAELVPPELITNAVSLNTSVFTSARIVGPALAGLLIGSVGLAACFLLNAASFLAVIVALWLMDPAELYPGPRQARAPGQIRAGLRYVRGNVDVKVALIMTGVVSLMAYNYQVVFPLFAERTFDGGATTYGLLLSAMSIGSLTGSLVSASRVTIGLRFVTVACAAFGLAMMVTAFSPTLPAAFVLVIPMGACGTVFVTSANAVLQTGTEPAMRGRVMALYSVVFLGSTPIGGPIVGALSETFGARAGLLAGSLTSLVTAAVVTAVVLRRRDHGVTPAGATEGAAAAG